MAGGLVLTAEGCGGAHTFSPQHVFLVLITRVAEVLHKIASNLIHFVRFGPLVWDDNEYPTKTCLIQDQPNLS